MNMEEDPNHYLLQPTADSNSHEIKLMKEDILCLKKERVERQVAEDKLVTAISELKHDAISMDFDREEKKIRVAAGDKEAWGRSNQDQRMEMIRATVNECFDNVSLRDKINIWITRPGRGNFLPWACLSFPTAGLKYTRTSC